MLGVLSLLTGGLRTTRLNNERVAATNLARELVEETRALDYDDIAGRSSRHGCRRAAWAPAHPGRSSAAA